MKKTGMSWRNGLPVKSIWEGGEEMGGAGDRESMIKMHSIKKKKRALTGLSYLDSGTLIRSQESHKCL